MPVAPGADEEVGEAGERVGAAADSGGGAGGGEPREAEACRGGVGGEEEEEEREEEGNGDQREEEDRSLSLLLQGCNLVHELPMTQRHRPIWP